MRMASGMKAFLLPLALIGFTASGCGRRDGPARVLVFVSGTVTLDGQPLDQGEVHFISPDGRTTEEGYFIDACIVKQGVFKGKTSAGERAVQIWSFKTSDAAPDPVTGDKPLPINVIPSRFSENSTLSASVTESGPNRFTFDITRGK